MCIRDRYISANFFGTTRRTVYRWINRAKHVGREHYGDKPRRARESKITVEVEVSILGWERQAFAITSKIYKGLHAVCCPTCKAIKTNNKRDSANNRAV